MRKLGVFAAVTVLSGCLFALEASVPKALVIMVDGLRADAIETGKMPNLQRLREGAWQTGYQAAWSVYGQTIADADPNSAPNHVSLATGVSSSRHGVTANGQTASGNYADYPTWLARVAAQGKSAVFAYTWSEDADLGPASGVTFLGAGDAANCTELETRLASATAPDATMYYIDACDAAGHNYGFYPFAAEYVDTLTQVDGYIGRLLNAIAGRATFADEDWMVVVTSDHGGNQTSHGQNEGRHCHTIPMVVGARGVQQGRIPGQPFIYDLTATVLQHMAVSAAVDGTVVGGTVVDEGMSALADNLVVYQSFDADAATADAGTMGVPVPTGDVALRTDGFIGCGLQIPAGGYVQYSGTENLSFGGPRGNSFTAMVWTRPYAYISGDPAIFGNEDWNRGVNAGVVLCAKTGMNGVTGPILNAGSGSHRIRIGAFASESETSWTFYLITCNDEGVISMYQGRSDGTLNWASGPLDDFTLSSRLPFCLGQDGTGAYGPKFVGDVDDFALWSRALTHEEIRRIYEAGRAGIELGDLLAADADTPEVSVVAYDGTTASLEFGGRRTASYTLCVASGATDQGDDKLAWDEFAQVAEIGPSTTSYAYTVPEDFRQEGRQFRFFLLKTAGLPYAQEVAYLQSAGQSWINTRIAPRRDTVVSTDLYILSRNAWWDWIFGSMNEEKISNFSLGLYQGTKWYWEIPGGNTMIDGFEMNTRYDVTFSVETLTVNGVETPTQATKATFKEHHWPMQVFRTLKKGASYDGAINGRIENFRIAAGTRTVRDLVAVADADGHGAFFDRIGGLLYPNIGTADFTLGAAVDVARTGWVRAQTTSLSANNSVPATAVWTGAAGDGDLSNGANWSCRNLAGQNLPSSVVPTEETVVTVRGETAFSVSAGQALACRQIVFENVKLTASADWRGLDVSRVATGGVVDLNGHTLDLSALGGLGTVTDSSEGEPGELRLAVAEGETLVNETTALSGNLKFVKDGIGTFVSARAGQTYVGGTVLLAGVVQMTGDMQARPLGETGSTVTVGADAVFDCNGQYGAQAYAFVLDGGVWANTGADQTQTNAGGLGRLTLTQDSTLLVRGSVMSAQGAAFDLGGHALTVTFGNGKSFVSRLSSMTNGTLRVSSGGWFRQAAEALDARTVDFDVASSLDLGAMMSVHDYTARYEGVENDGTAALNVFGTFLPVTDSFYGCTLQDGACLDLSQKTEPWNAAGCAVGGNRIVGFAAGATVTVDIHGRTLQQGTQLVAWSEAPANMTFAFDETTATAYPEVVPSAYSSGLFFGENADDSTPVTAVWTGAGNPANIRDPQNWICRNASETVLEGEIPSADVTRVTVSGATNFRCLTAGDVIWRTLHFEGVLTLSEDCDWRGIGTLPAEDLVVDLRGNRFSLTGAQLDSLGSCRIFDSGHGTPAAYSRYRFWVQKTGAADGAGIVQLSEVRLYAGAVNVSLPANGATVTAGAGASGGESGETFETVADGSLNTCWRQTLEDPSSSWIVFTYQTPVALTAYEWWTAENTGFAPPRNPATWRLQGSNDGSTWTDLDVQTDNRDAHRVSLAPAYCRTFCTPGEFHLDVAEGTVFESTRLVLDGNLVLVKEGQGDYRALRTQTYLGGTVIEAGCARYGLTSRDCPFGSGPVTVQAGADLDAWSRTVCLNHVILAGGRYLNTHNPACSDLNQDLGDISLTADSEMVFDPTTKLSADKRTQVGAVWDLGGHVLTVTYGGHDPDVYTSETYTGLAYPFVLRNGTLATRETNGQGWWHDCGTDGTQGGSYDFGTVLRLKGDTTVSNLTVRAGHNSKSVIPASTVRCSVYGTFAPLMDYCFNVTMLDGSTIDLSGRTETWSTTFVNDGSTCTCAFADGAQVTLALGARHPVKGEKILGWDETPANMSSLVFFASFNWCRPIKLMCRADGVYYEGTGMTVVFR